MPEIITAKNLSVTISDQNILDDLSIKIERGSITGLIGPSGSGKTTLMRTMVGVQKYRGQLSILDRPAGDKSLRTRIGYVTQTPAIYGDITILQNLQYFATIFGASDSKIQDTLELIHLSNHQNKLTANLSGGEQRRVSLAIALLGDPELLVLDEPTVGLDPILREELWSLFENLKEAGRTLLISSHVMDEAERCENLILIRSGKIVWNDTRDRLLAETNKTSVEEAFISKVKAS